MAKKKILHVIPNFNYGGAEIYLLDVLKHLDKNKFEIHIITLFTNVDWFDSEIEALSHIQFVKFDIKKNIFSVLKLFKRILSVKPDIIHAHLNLTILIIGFFKFFLRKPTYILTQHSVYEEGTFYYKALKYFLFSFDKVIANSNYTLEYLNKINGSKKASLVSIPLGIDFKRYQFNLDRAAICKELNIPFNAIIIGNIGRFKHHKGHCYLIEAFNIISKKQKDVYLVLVGNGELKEQVKNQALNLGIINKVFFIDETRDVSKFFTIFDIYCSTSISESFGITVLESIMFNVPVVSFDTDALPELVIENQTGLLCKKTDFLGLSNKVLFLINDYYSFNLIKDKQKKIINQYNINKHVKRIEALYETC